MTEQLLKISNSHVRNLSWLLFSPVMRVGEEYENTVFLFPQELQNEWLILHEQWLLELDKAPGELNSFIENIGEKRPLGVYAEYLLQFFFSKSLHVQLVWFNRQIVENGITETEIDFVIRYNNRLIHIELAVKYYLKALSGEWIGPNARDSFRQKWEKVSSLQIPAARRVINQVFPDEKIESYFLIKGFLFEDNSLCQNQWVYQRDVSEIVSQGSRFVFPEKPNWMADFIEFNGRTFGWSEIDKPIKKAIPMISLSKIKQKNYFIVADDWPDVLDNHR